MKLYVGGAWQGQTELAHAENPGAEIMENFHETIREAVKQGENPREFAERICIQHPQAVIVADEVGAGVVPMLAEDRAFREAVGRALCIVAQKAECVVRVTCGIGVRIK